MLHGEEVTHLVDKSFVVVDPDLDKAQLKCLCKAMKDSFTHHEAKSIVKMHTTPKTLAPFARRMTSPSPHG